MSLAQTIGRMLLGAAIFRSMRRSPKLVLIAAALAGLALMSIGTARAQTAVNPCPNGNTHCSRSDAYAGISDNQLVARLHCGDVYSEPVFDPIVTDETRRRFTRRVSCQGRGPGLVLMTWATDCPSNAPWNPATGQCEQSCTSKPDITRTSLPHHPAGHTAPNQATQCVAGCAVKFQNMHDGTYVGVHVSNAQCGDNPIPDGDCSQFGMVQGIFGCQAAPQECGPGQFKDALTGECSGNVCPAGQIVSADGACKPEAPTCAPGMIKAPDGSCLPGDGMCAVGEARGADGTCKKDSNGDGKPDGENEQGEDEDGNKFSGGDSCDKPPACSGNPVMCGQARIQWRIDCNTRTKANISGGSCGAIPICTGDGCKPLEYQQLIQQWKTSCALEKLGQGAPVAGRDGLLDWAKETRAADTEAANAIAGQGDGLDGIEPGDAWQKPPEPGTGSGISETLFGGSVTTCSLPGTGWDFFGHDLTPPPAFWTLASFIGWLIVASAYVGLAVALRN